MSTTFTDHRAWNFRHCFCYPLNRNSQRMDLEASRNLTSEQKIGVLAPLFFFVRNGLDDLFFSNFKETLFPHLILISVQ